MSQDKTIVFAAQLVAEDAMLACQWLSERADKFEAARQTRNQDDRITRASLVEFSRVLA